MTKYLYIGPDKQFNGLFYSKLSSPPKEKSVWQEPENEVFLISCERHEQITSKQPMIAEVDYGSLDDLNYAAIKCSSEQIAGLLWMGPEEDFKKQFKPLGKP